MYHEWSAKLGASIAGITFRFINAEWEMTSFPLRFYDIEDLEMRAIHQKLIIESSFAENPKLCSDVLVFYGTSDSESAVALGVFPYFSIGSKGCCEF